MTDRFTARLRTAADPAWTDATEHRFVRELGDGTLDDAVFRRYVVQDVAFVDALTSVVGAAVADAPDVAAKRRLAEFLTTVVGPESDYFERTFDALGVPESDRTSPTLDAPTRSFEHLLAHGASVGGYAETLAVLLPVEWVYLTWATNVRDGVSDAAGDAGHDRFYLDEWAAMHADSEFAAFVGWLRDRLDAEAASASDRRRDRMERLFVDAVELEVDFFDAAYEATDRGGDGSRRNGEGA